MYYKPIHKAQKSPFFDHPLLPHIQRLLSASGFSKPKANDTIEFAADLIEEQHRPDQSALETVPSLRQEATSPPHVEADDMEWDAARTHRPQGQATHAPAKAFAPPLGAPTPPCLGDDEETETESDMDEDDAPAVSLSRSKAAKAEATQDRAPKRDRKNQAYHTRMKDRRAAAKQKRDASAQSLTFVLVSTIGRGTDG